MSEEEVSEEEVSEEEVSEVDFLKEMVRLNLEKKAGEQRQQLAKRGTKVETDAEMRARVASEVDAMMDNGVRINPLLRQMYGNQ